MRSEFVSRLIDKQRAAGMDGATMAAELGISQSYWSLLCAGKRGLSFGLVKRATRQFPDLLDVSISDAVRPREDVAV